MSGSESRQPTREQLEQWDRQIVWHAFTQMSEYEPLIIESGQGCTLNDIDGRTYLDAVSSLWCNVHGHRHPRIDAAIRQQLDRVAHVTQLGTSNSTTIRLAKHLVDLAPDGLNHVFFSSDGSSAVEVALKMALQYWQQRRHPRPEKTCYAAFGDAYHGDTLGSVSVGGIEQFHAMFGPLLFEVVRLPSPQTYRLPDNIHPDAALDFYLSKVERLLSTHHSRLAALVIEPLVQCAAGMVVHPAGFLRGVADLCRRYDVLLIADEVAVGFGRTGTMFACEQEGVQPDLLCLAKGITGGYLPMSATLASDEIWHAFLGHYEDSKTFFHGHTYGGNPLAAAAALATLEVFDEEQTLAGLPEKIDCLSDHLRRLAQHPHVGDVRQCGLIGGIELVADRATKQPYTMQDRIGMRVCQIARQHGVLARPLGNVLVVMPPLSVTVEQIGQIVDGLEQGIVEVTER